MTLFPKMMTSIVLFLDSSRLISAPNLGTSGVPTTRFKETMAVFITGHSRSRRQQKNG